MQGAFEEHVEMCKSLGACACQVKKPEELEGLDALILPGGESTAISRVAARWGMVEPLQAWVRAGKPIWGTCAGLILLAKETVSEEGYVNPEVRTQDVDRSPGLLGGLDVVVHRNFFGSQVRSFEKGVQAPPRENSEDGEYNGLFIRAPAVVEQAEHVTVLATLGVSTLEHMGLSAPSEAGAVVALQQENVLATSFHPELTKDPRWHLYFFDIVCHYLDFGSPYVYVQGEDRQSS